MLRDATESLGSEDEARELAEHLGDSSIIHLRVVGIATLLSAKVGAGNHRVEAGQLVGLLPDPAWALAFDADQRLAA